MQIAILFLILVIASIPQCVNAGGRHHHPQPVPQQEEPPVINNYTTEVTNISNVYDVQGFAGLLASDHTYFNVSGLQGSATVSAYDYRRIGTKAGYSVGVGGFINKKLFVNGAVSGEDGIGVFGGRVNFNYQFR